MALAHANGIKIAYEAFGEPTAPSIIMMRGVGSQLVHWPRELVGGLVQSGLRVVVFDNRDSGLSTNFAGCPAPAMSTVIEALAAGQTLPPVYRLSDMVLDVVGLLDALGIERAHFLGLSLGAYVGQILAADYSDRLHTFVQLMSSPFLPMPQKMHPRIIKAMMAPPKSEDLQGVEDHALAVAWASSGSAYPIDEARFREDFRLANARGVWPGADCRQLIAAMTSGDRALHCQRIKIPTLIIHGREDPLVPFDEGRHTAELVATSQFTPIEGMGHELTPEVGLTLVPLLRAFLMQGRTRTTA